MRRVETSEADAWAVDVIQRNGADLLRYLTRRTSPPSDAADVLSNVMVIIWNRRAHLPRDETEARMWSFGVARNALRDHRRQSTRRTALADTLRAELHISAAEQLADPHEAAHRTQRSQDVRAALERLRPRDRELITLIHWDDFTLTQAAHLLGLNPSTARTRYARARQRLATDLNGHRTGQDLSHQDLPMRLPRTVNPDAS